MPHQKIQRQWLLIHRKGFHRKDHRRVQTAVCWHHRLVKIESKLRKDQNYILLRIDIEELRGSLRKCPRCGWWSCIKFWRHSPERSAPSHFQNWYRDRDSGSWSWSGWSKGQQGTRVCDDLRVWSSIAKDWEHNNCLLSWKEGGNIKSNPSLKKDIWEMTSCVSSL